MPNSEFFSHIVGGSIAGGYLGEVERLRQRDIEALLSYLRKIYVFSDLEGFASRVVSTLSQISHWRLYGAEVV